MADKKPETGAAEAVADAAPFTLDFRVKLTAIVTPEAVGGYSASVTDLPGCYTEAETVEELRDNLREAAEGWIAAHAEQLRAGPPPGSPSPTLPPAGPARQGRERPIDAGPGAP